MYPYQNIVEWAPRTGRNSDNLPVHFFTNFKKYKKKILKVRSSGLVQIIVIDADFYAENHILKVSEYHFQI